MRFTAEDALQFLTRNTPKGLTNGDDWLATFGVDAEAGGFIVVARSIVETRRLPWNEDTSFAVLDAMLVGAQIAQHLGKRVKVQ